MPKLCVSKMDFKTMLWHTPKNAHVQRMMSMNLHVIAVFLFIAFFYREKEPIIYEGDLMDEEGVLDFLTSLEAMDLPDRIEEVNAKILSKIIEETDYVAVLFCKCMIFSLTK